WDGTLADTPRHTFKIYQEIFAELGKELTFADFKKYFGQDHTPLYNFLGLTPEQRKQVDGSWFRIYSKVQQSLRLYPQAKRLLRHLKESGYKIGLVTSGKEWRISQELEMFGIENLFDTIVTVEHIKKPKPAPDGLLLAAKKLKVSTTDCIYVGDMSEDIVAGKRAGMKTGIVVHGMHEHSNLGRLKPDLVIEKFNSRYFKHTKTSEPKIKPTDSRKLDK
ncbi:MAG: hypothetical protein COV47_03915, partial [Candidatus Diapherotrites archaeon CG11_big_fil_rev_8_21_14_0_20_37_9]